MRLTPIAFVLWLASPIFAQATPAQSGADATAPAAGVAESIPPEVQRLVQQAVKNMRAQMEAKIAACPVGFSVDRRGSAGLEVTKAPDGRLGQGLDLSFRTGRTIVEADITVHGMTARPRVIQRPLREFDDDAEDFVLKGTVDEPVKLSSVWMKQLGTVSWVELTRVAFSDGTTWTPAGEMRCTARPSLLVLVNASEQSR